MDLDQKLTEISVSIVSIAKTDTCVWWHTAANLHPIHKTTLTTLPIQFTLNCIRVLLCRHSNFPNSIHRIRGVVVDAITGITRKSRPVKAKYNLRATTLETVTSDKYLLHQQQTHME